MTRKIYWGILLLLVMVAGCKPFRSQLPLASTYEAEAQYKMQSAGHWQLLASDVADSVLKALEDRDDLLMTPLYMRPPDSQPFSMGFYNLLTSELVSRGMQVSLQRESEVVDLAFNVYAVKHNPRFQRPPVGSFTALSGTISAARAIQSMQEWIPAALGAGVLADITSGAFTRPSDREILITVSMAYNNRYVVHRSSVYYIHDPDFEHYVNAENTGHIVNEYASRPVKVVTQ